MGVEMYHAWVRICDGRRKCFSVRKPRYCAGFAPEPVERREQGQLKRMDGWRHRQFSCFVTAFSTHIYLCSTLARCAGVRANARAFFLTRIDACRARAQTRRRQRHTHNNTHTTTPTTMARYAPVRICAARRRVPSCRLPCAQFVWAHEMVPLDVVFLLFFFILLGEGVWWRCFGENQ